MSYRQVRVATGAGEDTYADADVLIGARILVVIDADGMRHTYPPGGWVSVGLDT